MKPSAISSAVAASDAYKDRPLSDVDNKSVNVDLGGHPYTIYATSADARTGFHATAYQNTEPPYNVIIAYRGTDTDFVHHARTGAQDIGVDVEMVKDQTNRQKHAADVFTDEVLAKAEKQGIPRDQISLAGHSLGGVFVEIEAHRHGLRGVTINGYGAVDLNYGVPEGGDRVVNYRMASDMVSAGSRHSGQVITLADDNDIRALTAGRYLNAASGSPPPNPLLVVADNPGAHGRAHFAPEPGSHQVSVLSPELLAKYQQNYENHKAGIDHFRDDVHRERTQLAEALRSPDSRNLISTYAHLPTHMQQQLAELHALKVDKPIQEAVEHNAVVKGTQLGLDQANVALRIGGDLMQQSADRSANDLRAMGHRVEQQADDLSHRLQAVASIDPLTVGAAALGVKAAGYVAHTQTEDYAQATQMAGHTARVAGQFIANQVQTTGHGVEQGAHAVAEGAQGVVHVAEAVVVRGADAITDTRQAVNHASADVVSAVSHTLDAVDRRLHPTPPGHEALGVLPAAPSLDPATLRAMQTHLNTLGVRDTRGQPLAVSGTYDRATRRGVEDFQEVHGLPVTGLPDRATVSLLEAHVKIAELQKPSTALDPQTVAATLPRATPAEQPREVPHGLVVDRAETQASQQRPLSDPSHPQHALYSELKGLLPKAASEERLAQLTLACHQGNIKPGRIESITLENKHAVIVGLAGYANVDMSHPSPPLQQSLQKMENIHQQQSQQQILSPQQSPSQGGQSLSRSLH
ncbi:peptidoglycan-binding domain-containing protein [Dyella japonica]|uniref:Esterase YcpF (UPF0227 family) n=1 Tax=Dyella japonica TaxID=231455 RepID=A0ABV2JSQ8_9GAMM